jgi:hypothetical protein
MSLPNLLFLTWSSVPPTLERNAPVNDHILNAIDEEIARLRQARALLGNVSNGTSRKTAGKPSAATVSGPKPRRKLSAKARHAIAEAQRKRWARVKAQKKSSATAPAAEK